MAGARSWPRLAGRASAAAVAGMRAAAHGMRTGCARAPLRWDPPALRPGLPDWCCAQLPEDPPLLVESLAESLDALLLPTDDIQKVLDWIAWLTADTPQKGGLERCVATLQHAADSCPATPGAAL
jgi:hypothetical protein